MSTAFENLMGKKNAELVEIYNKLAEGTRNAQIGSWKQAKEGLVNRILGLGYAEKSYDITDLRTEEAVETPVDLSDPTVGTNEPDLTGEEIWEPVATKSNKPTKPKPTKPKSDDDAPQRTIKQACVELLCVVDHYENRETGKRDDGPNFTNCRSVGLSYAEILRRLKDEFPDCTTKAESLRWYAVKMRTGEHGFSGHVLPQKRPQERTPK